MVKGKVVYFVLSILAAAFISACAAQGTPPPAFDTQPVTSGKWNKKVDHLYFIMDASSSMDESYKLERARSVIANFNQTMPALDLMVTLRTFGHDPSVAAKSSDLMVMPQAYAPGVVAAGLSKVSKAGGFSPLDRALKDAADDLKEVSAPIAMIIVSDAKDMTDAPVAAAKALNESHAGRLCIYTVQVGAAAGGQRLLSMIAQSTDCGRAMTADSLATGAAMNAFVTEVLLAGMTDSDGDGIADGKDRCPNTPRGVKVDMSGCPLDSDMDGVPDYKDQCPDTLRGTKVDAKGCPFPVATLGKVTAAGTYIFEDIQFETNKADLKTSSYPALSKIVEAMRAQQDLKIEIQGHTDSTGKHDYNVGLSQRRAASVKAYLVSKGIAAARMTTVGYGPDHPIDTNKTSAGRSKNRRVELKPIR